MLLRVVAVTARIDTEIEEFKRSRNSRSVWKLHADSLVVLIDLAKRLDEAVDRLALVIAAAHRRRTLQRPAKIGRATLRHSLEKLRERTAEAAKLIGEAIPTKWKRDSLSPVPFLLDPEARR